MAAAAGQEAARLSAEATFQVNLFQVIIAAANFVLFLAMLYFTAARNEYRPIFVASVAFRFAVEASQLHRKLSIISR